MTAGELAGTRRGLGANRATASARGCRPARVPARDELLLVRSTKAGRQRIATKLRLLRQWCELHGPAWTPPAQP